uniref:Uncharacterized protein n=1 Tax=Setaria viridis TaxID=4556 RepID=A0A4U6UEI5_SETVI|nr:hypothetical protein SEVIR_5G171700v2 [Setaria viridis]
MPFRRAAAARIREVDEVLMGAPPVHERRAAPAHPLSAPGRLSRDTGPAPPVERREHCCRRAPRLDKRRRCGGGVTHDSLAPGLHRSSTHRSTTVSHVDASRGGVGAPARFQPRRTDLVDAGRRGERGEGGCRMAEA